MVSLPTGGGDESMERLSRIFNISVSKCVLFSDIVHENRTDAPSPDASKLGVITLQEATDRRP